MYALEHKTLHLFICVVLWHKLKCFFDVFEQFKAFCFFPDTLYKSGLVYIFMLFRNSYKRVN